VRAAGGAKSRLEFVGRELLAGLTVLPLALPFLAAAGVIAYGPLGPDHAMRGAIAGLICGAVGGIVAALLRGPSALVMSATTPMAAVQASVLGTIIVTLGTRSDLHPAALPVLLVLTGLMQILLGAMGAMRLVKFVPYPVVSGFVSGIGALLLLNFAPAMPLCALAPVVILSGWLMIDPYSGSILRRAVATPSHTRSQARRNALIHFSVLLPTALNRPLIGVAVGIVLSCSVFIVSMSRPIIRCHQDGRVLASKRVRTRTETEILANHAEAMALFDLEGALFFGNAEDLARAIKAREQARVVILNCRGVSDIDATGIKIIEQARKSLLLSGRRLLIARLPQPIDAVVQEIFGAEDCFREVDDALEFAENMVLRQHAISGRTRIEGAAGPLLQLSDFDLFDGASAGQLQTLASLLQHQSLPAGTTLCHEGDPADRMWMIRSGTVSIRVGNSVRGPRIAALGPGTTIGEMAMIEDKPRSASVIVDEPVDLYVLTSDAFREIIARDPAIASLILGNISRDLSRRLRRSSADLYAALN
jgi:MFS superfamily sulfate permease-like transporter